MRNSREPSTKYMKTNVTVIQIVKHTQTIRRQQQTNCLSVFIYFVVLKGLRFNLKSQTRYHNWKFKFLMIAKYRQCPPKRSNPP